AEDGIRDFHVTGVQTCALPIFFVPTSDNTLLAIETVAPPLSIYFAKIDPKRNIAKLDATNPASDVIYEFCLPNTVSRIGTSLNRSEERRVGKDSRSNETQATKK